MTTPQALAWPPHPRYGVRPFRAGDHFLIEARADFAAEHAAEGRPLDDGLPKGALAWTLLRDGAPIGIGLLIEAPGRRWRMGAYLAEFGRSDWAYAMACVRAAMAHVRGQLGARRIEATARVASPQAARLLRHLGLACIGEVRAPDGAYHLMSIEGGPA